MWSQNSRQVPPALFRVAQEALSIALKLASVKSTGLMVRVEMGEFSMSCPDDGTPNSDNQMLDPAMTLASLRHRIHVLSGQVQILMANTGATVLTDWMPYRSRARLLPIDALVQQHGMIAG
jgi:signal transduction histidine kinase